MIIMARWPHYARTCGERIAPYAPDDNQCFNEDFVVVINRKMCGGFDELRKEGVGYIRDHEPIGLALGRAKHIPA